MSDFEPEPTDDESPDEAEDAEAGEAAPQEGKRFVAVPPETLDSQHFMIADERIAGVATLRGGAVAGDRGDAHFVGDALRKLADALRELATLYREGVADVSNALVRHVAIGNSVTMELEISEPETVTVGLDGRRRSPTIEAARTMRDLLGGTPEDVFARALELGPNAAAAYKGFLKVLAREDVTLEWRIPEVADMPVITSDAARLDVAVLETPGKPTAQTLPLPGTLTMADSELRQFKLTLPGDLQDRHPLIKGKHRIHGTYREGLEQKLKDEGLWDSEVNATIEITYDIPGSTPMPRSKTYCLLDAEPVPVLPSLFDDVS